MTDPPPPGPVGSRSWVVDRAGSHRTDPLTGFEVQVVGTRQERPNLPGSGCPFCVGGTEAPEPYVTRAFPNRWPSFPDDRCEVLLYSPDHDATLASMGPTGARRVVELWAERTEVLGARPDVAYVLVFENHGSQVGATIAHPHGQVFAYDRVPELPERELGRLAAGHDLLEPDADGCRVVVERDGWRAWVPHAPTFPYTVRLAPLAPVPDLPSLTAHDRDVAAALLVDVLGRYERLFTTAMPYMFWWHQRPTDGGRWPGARLHLEIAGPWRAEGLMRFIAGAEVGSGSFVNPVDPDDAADALRAAGP